MVGVVAFLLGVSINEGSHNSWMVYNGKSERKMDDDWGNPGLNRTNMDDLGGPKSWRYPNSWMDG